MHADHIIQKCENKALMWEVDNGQTLCPNCHMRKTLNDKIRH